LPYRVDTTGPLIAAFAAVPALVLEVAVEPRAADAGALVVVTLGVGAGGAAGAAPTLAGAVAPGVLKLRSRARPPAVPTTAAAVRKRM
jgi:hypothetical protein